MAVARMPRVEFISKHCSYSNLFKGFILLAITVAGMVVLYNGGYGSSSGAYELDVHSSFNGGEQSHKTTKKQHNISEERTQKRINHAVHKLKQAGTGSRVRNLLDESNEDWLMNTSDTAQHRQQSVSVYKMAPPEAQIRSSSYQEPEEEQSISATSVFKSLQTFPSSILQTPRLYLPAMQHYQEPQTQTVRPTVQMNSTRSLVVDHFATTSCNKSCRWWREQTNRQRRVQETCSDLRNVQSSPSVNFNLNPVSLRSLSHLLVLDKQKLIYCYIPKVGCTNWKRIFLVAKGLYPSAKEIEQRTAHTQTDKHMRLLSSYPITEAKRMLKEYQTFMFARHPFERIVSAYIDKFEMDYPSSTKFRREIGPQIMRYGDAADRSNPRKMKDGTLFVTFQQFVRFVSDPKNRVLEPHWAEMYSECQPCMIQYDILGNYSTLIEDANVIIELARLNQEYPASTNPTGSSERMLRYFSQLTSAEIQQLRKRYAIDFSLFGYSVPNGINV
ncbi:carbohydrate sulfotransferase 11-like [Asterias amurensis]|uniref:carbohydrate sulfotransferase 11-like n=1 Tax=Asterias amurensis TaxID=7602 RepID=UPI003AB6B7AC